MALLPAQNKKNAAALRPTKFTDVSECEKTRAAKTSEFLIHCSGRNAWNKARAREGLLATCPGEGAARRSERDEVRMDVDSRFTLP